MALMAQEGERERERERASQRFNTIAFIAKILAKGRIKT